MKRFLSIILCLITCFSGIAIIPTSAADSTAMDPVPEIRGETSRQTSEILLPDGTGSGVMWTKINLSGYYGDNRVVNVAQFDLANTHLSIEVSTCGKYITDLQKLSDAAKEYDGQHPNQSVLAAINGDLWMTEVHSSSTVTKKVLKVTRGVLIIDGEIWASQQIDQENLDATNGEKGASVGELSCFGVTYDNQPVVGSPDVQIAIEVGGTKITADGLNRLPANNSIIVYNHRVNDSNYAMNDSYEIELQVEKSTAFYSNGQIKARVVAIYEPSSDERPALNDPKRIVLTGRGTRLEELANNFSIGDEVTLSTKIVDRWGRTELWEDVKEAIGGHMLTMMDGKLSYVNSKFTNYPTTLIGYKDNGEVMMVTVTSAKSGSREALVHNQAYDFCREMGYNSVFFLDGGGSCTFLTVENGKYTVRNKCSDGQPRAVSTAVLLVWNNEPVCEQQGSLDYIKTPIDLSSLAPTYLDGALLMEISATTSALDLSYDEEEKALCMTTSKKTKNPNASMQFVRLAEINAEDYPYIVMKVKTDNPDPTDFGFYYGTGTNYGASSSRVKTVPIEGADAGWQYVIADMTTQSDWTGRINNIRFDPFDAVQTPKNTSIYIGSVTLCSTLEEAQAVESGWMPEDCVPDYLEYLSSLPAKEDQSQPDENISGGDTPNENAQKNNEYTLPIAIGAAIVATVAAFICFITKKRKNKNIN